MKWRKIVRKSLWYHFIKTLNINLMEETKVQGSVSVQRS